MRKLIQYIVDSYPFGNYYLISFFEYVFCIILQAMSYFLLNTDCSAYFIILLFLTSLIFLVIFANTFQKPTLLKLDYNWHNMHLFTRAITVSNIITTVAIAFLIGVKPALYDYLDIATKNNLCSFLIDASLAWIGCVASAEHIMLEHIEKIWYRQEDKKHWDEHKK